MSQFDDDEERETLYNRQKRHEDIAMKGGIDPQQATQLLRKQ